MDLWEFLLFLVLQRTCSGLEVTVPLSQTASPGSNVLLPCTFRVKDSTVNPNFLAVVWKFGDKELVKFDNKGLTLTLKASIDPQAALKGDATLTLHNVTVSNEGTYKCIVIYSPEIDQKPIDLRLQATPSVKMTKKALLKNHKNRLVCSATDFYPRGITMTWLRNGQVLLTSDMGKPQGNADGTYSVNSSVILNPTETQGNQLIKCQVEHESLGNPITDEYIVIYGEQPTVQIYSMEIPGRREKVVVCDVSGFYPEAIMVNWKLEGKPLDTSSRDAGGTFNKRIYSNVRPSPDNEPEDFSCEVQHETLFSPITETHQVRYFSDQDKSCHLGLAVMLGILLTLAGVGLLLWVYVFKKKYFQRFMMSPIYGPEKRNDDDDKVTFYCVAFNCPKDIQVTWRVTEAGGDTLTLTDPMTKDEEERLLGCGYTIRTDQSEDKGLHKVITALNFTPSVSKHNNTTIVSRFTSDGKTKEEKLKWSFTLPKPQVSGEKPIVVSLGDSGDVLCSTELKDFNPKGIAIKWSCGAGHYQDLETFNEKITANSQQTYDAKSECSIPEHRFKETGFKVRVTWRHDSMEEPERREVSATDLPWRPQMSEISVPCLLHGTETKLQCTISGYFPDALTVNWLRREAGKPDLFPVSPSDKYKFPVEDVTRREDQTYSCTASLIVNVSRKTDHGAEFICQVGHPSLERPLEKRTGELNVAGIPVVNVFLDDTQSDCWLIAEVGGFYPQNIDIKWSRIKSKGEYEEYPASDFTKEIKENRDGTFQLTSKRKAKGIDDKKSFKVSVTHESLESPIEMIVVKRQDAHFITGKEGKRLLPKPSSPKKQSHPHHETADKDAHFIKGKEGKRPLPKLPSLKKQSHHHHETTDKGSRPGSSKNDSNQKK